METSFRRASRALKSAELKTVETVLREWQREPIGRVVAVNLRDLEHFLPKRHMLCLLRRILASNGVPFLVAKDGYQDECYRHQRKGGPVRTSPPPHLVGRAVDASDFAKYLHRHYPIKFPLETHAKDFVDKQLKADVPLDREFEKLLMSAFSAWVTWNLDSPGADPFDFVAHGLAVEVRAALGMDRRKKGPVLLLRYHRPTTVVLHRPTIADAELFPYFNPPIGSEKEVSFTRPWEPFDLPLHPGGTIEASPQPEAVHRPIELRHLALPISELK